MTTLHLTDNELQLVVDLLDEREADLAYRFNRLREDPYSKPEAITHYFDKMIAVEQLLNQISDAQNVEAAS